MQRIYLDYAATTPLAPEVARAMEPYFAARFGNPSSLHSFGQEAIAAADMARETIAKSIGANFREVIFTGSATEANNLALRGVARSIKYQVSSIKKRNVHAVRPKIIISAIEHESIHETARDLEREGVEVVEIPVSREGVIDVKKLEHALDERTVLVSVMYANNEIGTVQPISEIARIIADLRNRKLQIPSTKLQTNSKFQIPNSKFAALPLFHTDAAQAFQFLDCNVEKLGVDPVRSRARAFSTSPKDRGAATSNGVDLLTLSAHKIYGPKGIGALYVRQQSAKSKAQSALNKRLAISDWRLAPVVTGGGQEFGLRSGTENVPGIVGFAEAVRHAARMRVKEAKRIAELREVLWRGIKKAYPRAEVNGVQVSSIKYQVSSAAPHVLNVYFPGVRAEELLVKLDRAGVAASAGPACSSRSLEPSRVVQALGHSAQRARESVRFSMGRYTTAAEIGRAVRGIAHVI